MATAKLFLDRRALPEDAPAPLKIAINHRGSSAYVPLGVKLRPDQWDAPSGRVVNHRDKAKIQRLAAARLAQVEDALAALRVEGRLAAASAAQARRLVLDRLNPREPRREGLLARLDRYAATRHAPRTREIYQATAKRLREFCPDADSLAFEDVTKAWLQDFDRWLAARSPSRNARNIHLRNIRAAFNDAIDDGVTAAYPFRRLKITPEPTRKRALTPAQLRSLFAPRRDPAVEAALDYFRLSFLLIGINTADMCGLREVTAAGRVEYRRQKTGKLYSVKVEPEAAEIIARRRGAARLVDLLELRGNVHAATIWVNKYLGRVIPGLTMYWARHTWATVAAELDIPADTISRALGHSFSTGAAVTSIYVDFNARKIDRANRAVIDFALGLI